MHPLPKAFEKMGNEDRLSEPGRDGADDYARWLSLHLLVRPNARAYIRVTKGDGFRHRHVAVVVNRQERNSCQHARAWTAAEVPAFQVPGRTMVPIEDLNRCRGGYFPLSKKAPRPLGTSFPVGYKLPRVTVKLFF